jgi:PEP-CTERM motif
LRRLFCAVPQFNLDKTVTETTWFDASDTAFGVGTKLATATFTSIDTNNPGVTTIVDALKPYSITEEYDVTIPLSSPPIALSTISLGTTDAGPIPIVPEPSTWTMIALGFAGLADAAYGRGRKSRVPAPSTGQPT